MMYVILPSLGDTEEKSSGTKTSAIMLRYFNITTSLLTGIRTPETFTVTAVRYLTENYQFSRSAVRQHDQYF